LKTSFKQVYRFTSLWATNSLYQAR